MEINQHPQHLAKNLYLRHDGEFNYELLKKGIRKKGKQEGDVYYDTVGYYSNMKRVLAKVKDMGYIEWINGDVAMCKNFIDEAVASIKKLL